MVNNLIPYFANPLKEENGMPAHCGFRWILKVDDLYHEFDEGYFDRKWQIFTRTSKDGYVFSPKSEPLFPAGGENDFDFGGQADPTVIYEDGLWHMWFDAFDVTLHWDKLGYATSKDNKTWINHGPCLSRGTGDEWDSKSIHHPVCIKHEGKYYLYYSGCKDDVYNVKDIGLAISEDRKNWVKQGQVIVHGKIPEWDDRYVRPSKPIFLDGRWYMFYWGFNGLHHMGLAVSDDLIHWEKLGRIMEGINEKLGITASMPIEDENGLRIYWASFDDIRLRVAKICTL